jgi:outer membrane protein OmpA-like peptidoglycan-associated protein
VKTLLLVPFLLLAAEDPEAQVKKVQRMIDQGVLPKIEFDFDSDRLRPETTFALDLIGNILLENPEMKLRINAHTCTIGGDEYNMDLSERRARTVKEYLVKMGVPPPSIRFKGYGPLRPLADNTTEPGRAKNRRVEFVVVKHNWGSVY